MAITTPKGLQYMYVDQSNKEQIFNEALMRIDVLVMPLVIDKDLTAPPAGVDGAAYIPATGATGLWLGLDGQLVSWSDEASQWLAFEVSEGYLVWIIDEKRPYRHNGTNFVPAHGYDAMSAVDSITASATQTQAGATALTTQCVRLTTVATTGNSVRIGQRAVLGAYQEILNSGANAAWIWPAVGDAIDAAAVDARDANALAAAAVRRYRCFTAGVWRTM